MIPGWSICLVVYLSVQSDTTYFILLTWYFNRLISGEGTLTVRVTSSEFIAYK